MIDTKNTVFEGLDFIIDGKKPENKVDPKLGTENKEEKEEPVSFSLEEIQNSLKEPKTTAIADDKTEKDKIIEAAKNEGVVIKEDKEETNVEGENKEVTVFSTLSE